MPYFTFTCLMSDEVPQMANIALTNTMDASKPLLDAVRIPRQIIVHHQMRSSVKVDSFPGRVGSHQHKHFWVVLKSLLNLPPPLSWCAAVDRNHGALVSKAVRQFFYQ